MSIMCKPSNAGASGSSVVACLVAALFWAPLHAQDALDEKVVDVSGIKWNEAGGGNGFPIGVRTALQGVDSVTGGITYYALFPAGSKFEPHWHTHDEFVVVARGSLAITLKSNMHELQVGSYVVIPGSVIHEWKVPAHGEDAVILVRRAGPADFHFATKSD